MTHCIIIKFCLNTILIQDKYAWQFNSISRLSPEKMLSKCSIFLSYVLLLGWKCPSSFKSCALSSLLRTPHLTAVTITGPSCIRMLRIAKKHAADCICGVILQSHRNRSTDVPSHLTSSIYSGTSVE